MKTLYKKHIKNKTTMTKKERKANLVLEEARQAVKRIMTETKNAPKAHPFTPKKEVVVKKKVEVPEVTFADTTEKYDEIEIIKVKKGEYRAKVKKNGQRFDIATRFKSITKAEEWKEKHLA